MSNSNVLIHGRAPGNQKLSIRCDEYGYLFANSTIVDQDGNFIIINGDGGITSRMQGTYYDASNEPQYTGLLVDSSGNLTTVIRASNGSLTQSNNALDVNVKNANIDISGSIAINNWPELFDVSGNVNVTGTVNSIIDNSSSILIYGSDGTLKYPLYVDSNGYTMTNIIDSANDKIIYDLEKSKVELTYGSGNEWTSNPNSIANGWYYTNNQASNIGYLYWYNNGNYSNLVTYPTQTNIKYNEIEIFYSMMSLYDVNYKPKIIIYSKPTGTGDYLPNVCHSIWEFSINSTVLNNGENIMVYFGDLNKIKTYNTDIRRVPLVLTSTNGQALPTEEIGHIFIRTYTTPSANNYKLNITECGLFSAQTKLLEYTFDNSKKRIEEDNLNKLSFNNNKLVCDISGQYINISSMPAITTNVDISGQYINVSNFPETQNTNSILMDEFENKISASQLNPTSYGLNTASILHYLDNSGNIQLLKHTAGDLNVNVINSIDINTMPPMDASQNSVSIFGYDTDGSNYIRLSCDSTGKLNTNSTVNVISGFALETTQNSIKLKTDNLSFDSSNNLLVNVINSSANLVTIQGSDYADPETLNKVYVNADGAIDVNVLNQGQIHENISIAFDNNAISYCAGSTNIGDWTSRNPVALEDDGWFYTNSAVSNDGFLTIYDNQSGTQSNITWGDLSVWYIIFRNYNVLLNPSLFIETNASTVEYNISPGAFLAYGVSYMAYHGSLINQLRFNDLECPRILYDKVSLGNPSNNEIIRKVYLKFLGATTPPHTFYYLVVEGALYLNATKTTINYYFTSDRKAIAEDKLTQLQFTTTGDALKTSIINTPSVKIDNTANTVKIDSTTNTVKIDGTTNTVKLSTDGNTVKFDTTGTNNNIKLALNSSGSDGAIVEYLDITKPVGQPGLSVGSINYARNITSSSQDLLTCFNNTTAMSTNYTALDTYIRNSSTGNDKVPGFSTLSSLIGLNTYVIPTKTRTFCFNAYTNFTGTNRLLGSFNQNISYDQFNFGLANSRQISVSRSATSSATLNLTMEYIDASGNEKSIVVPAPLPTNITFIITGVISVNKWKTNASLTANDTINIAFGGGINFSYAGGNLQQTNNGLFTCPNNAIAWVQNVSFVSSATDNLKLLKWDATGARSVLFGWGNASNFNSNATGEYGFGGYITAGETIGWGGETSTTYKWLHSNVVVRYL